jgi:hypothetical protein
MCSHQCPQTIACLPFSQNLKKNIEKNSGKDKQTKTMNNLGAELTHELSLEHFFWSGPISFPFKMMPCKQSHSLICLGLDPHLKALRPI